MLEVQRMLVIYELNKNVQLNSKEMLKSRIKQLCKKQDCTILHGDPCNKSPNQAQIETHSSSAQEVSSRESKAN